MNALQSFYVVVCKCDYLGSSFLCKGEFLSINRVSVNRQALIIGGQYSEFLFKASLRILLLPIEP